MSKTLGLRISIGLLSVISLKMSQPGILSKLKCPIIVVQLTTLAKVPQIIPRIAIDHLICQSFVQTINYLKSSLSKTWLQVSINRECALKAYPETLYNPLTWNQVFMGSKTNNLRWGNPVALGIKKMAPQLLACLVYHQD